MNISNYLCIVISLYIFTLGIFVYLLPDRKKVKTNFSILCMLIAIWVISFTLRQFVKSEYRHLAFDWMLIPTIFFPILLDRIVTLISNPNNKISKVKFATLLTLSSYFSIAAFNCSYSIIIDTDNFTYTSTIHYHFLILYQISYSCFCAYKLKNYTNTFRGNQKVQFKLMSLGVIIILIFAVTFIYILPLMGIFQSYLATIGAIIALSLWSVAILQHNAFELKSDILSGKYVPLLKRITLYPFLGIFFILDPKEFQILSHEFKSNTVSDFLSSDLILKSTTNLNTNKRAEVLARKYNNYLK